MVIGQRGLNQGNIDGDEAPGKKTGDLRKEDGSIIRHPLVDRRAGNVADEERVVAEVMLEFSSV